MIDFQKELAKFNFSEIDPEFTQFYSETAQLLAVCSTALKRIGKELNHANLQLEDVLAQSAEEKEKDRYLAEQKKMIEACEAEKLSLIEELVAALDQLEDIYRYASKNENNSWFEPLRHMWERSSANLLSRGIIRIEGEQALFDSRIHAALQVKEEENLPDGTILEVLRCGYIYQSNVLRKAQVIVNKTDGGTDSNE